MSRFIYLLGRLVSFFEPHYALFDELSLASFNSYLSSHHMLRDDENFVRLLSYKAIFGFERKINNFVPWSDEIIITID